MIYECYQIQYHAEFTKFYFRNGDFKVNISIPIKRSELWKWGNTYHLNDLLTALV